MKHAHVSRNWFRCKSSLRAFYGASAALGKTGKALNRRKRSKSSNAIFSLSFVLNTRTLDDQYAVVDDEALSLVETQRNVVAACSNTRSRKKYANAGLRIAST